MCLFVRSVEGWSRSWTSEEAMRCLWNSRLKLVVSCGIISLLSLNFNLMRTTKLMDLKKRSWRLYEVDIQETCGFLYSRAWLKNLRSVSRTINIVEDKRFVSIFKRFYIISKKNGRLNHSFVFGYRFCESCVRRCHWNQQTRVSYETSRFEIPRDCSSRRGDRHFSMADWKHQNSEVASAWRIPAFVEFFWSRRKR